MKWREAFLQLKEIPQFEDAVPPWKCAHEKTSPTRYFQRNGVLLVRHQCAQCGTFVRGPRLADLRKQGVTIDALPLWDEPLARRWTERKAHFEQTQNPLQARLALYQEYLQSDTWKSKRERVLRRDDYLCQACCHAKAVQVHHKTYEFIGDEPLYQLISVCIECHYQLHRREPFL